MPRSGPISLSLPAFSGVTRKLILANVATFFAILLLRWLTPHLADLLLSHLWLEPRAVAHGELWQLFTYSFLEQGILAILFGMLTLWFTGSLLEPSFGSRWLAELYFSSVIGGAIIASAISFTHIFGLRPDIATAGCWSGIFGLLAASSTSNSPPVAASPSDSASATSASATATTAGSAAAPPASSRSTCANKTAKSTSTKTAATSTPTNSAKTPTTNAG